MTRGVLATLVLSLAVVAAGCGSTEKKDDESKGEVIHRPVEDPPVADDRSPPMGKPKAKVSPSEETHNHDLKASDSFYRDETPH